jgi:hypothetical protein
VETDLLGHLLKANDPATERAVEDRLARDPAAARALARLRAALAPLAADRDGDDPPADLWVRALGRVAEHMVATEGPAGRATAPPATIVKPGAGTVDQQPAVAVIRPAPAASEAAPPPVRRWNVVAGIGLSLSLLALVVPGIMHMRAAAQRTACSNAMGNFYRAAAGYTDTNEGNFPRVPDGKPAATAVVTLQDAGYLPPDVRFACPAAPPNNASQFALATYAYTLGFRDQDGQLHGLDRSAPGQNLLPILADAPGRGIDSTAFPINHRHGQNVLFANGNVRFCTTTTVGIDGDDIFCNKDGAVSAGRSWDDTVLGRPEERP